MCFHFYYRMSQTQTCHKVLRFYCWSFDSRHLIQNTSGRFTGRNSSITVNETSDSGIKACKLATQLSKERCRANSERLYVGLSSLPTLDGNGAFYTDKSPPDLVPVTMNSHVCKTIRQVPTDQFIREERMVKVTPGVPHRAASVSNMSGLTRKDFCPFFRLHFRD